jgi:SOS-response transcriptional repressor LexA
MAGADIYSNDILLVDRPIELVSGEIVICAMGGERKLQKSLA